MFSSGCFRPGAWPFDETPPVDTSEFGLMSLMNSAWMNSAVARRGSLAFAGPAARLALLAALLSPVAACSTLEGLNPFAKGEKYETKILPDEPADAIYDQGLARLSKKDNEGAAKRFTELDKQFPFSQQARKGLLMSAYSYYNGGQYDDAISSANRFVSLYPSSPDAAYAMYLAAMSYYNQVPDITRDQNSSEKGLGLFQQLVERYPKSEYIDDAKYKITVLRDQVAGKEMSIGRYYLGRNQYQGAINRFDTVLAKYQTTRHVEEALYRLTEAYLALGIVSEAQTAASILGHNYPDSPWYKDAYDLLQKGGLSPNDDGGGILSRLAKKVGLG